MEGRQLATRVWNLRTAVAFGAVVAAVAPAGAPVANAQQIVWLNVNVEMRASSEGQRSWATASTSSDKEGLTKIRVQKLHLVLDGHARQERSARTATPSGWTNTTRGS